MAINIINHTNEVNKSVGIALDKQLPMRKGLSNFFTRETIRTNMISNLFKKNKRLIATDVVSYGEGKFNKSAKITETLYIPPVYEENYFFESDELYMTTVAKGLFTSKTVNQEVAEKALMQMRYNREMIELAIIKQQWDFATTGIISLKNNDSINFNRQAASLVNVSTASGYSGVYWNNLATSKVLTDYQKAGEFLRREGLSTSGTFYSIMSSTAYNLLSQSAQLKEELDIRRVERSKLNMPEIDLIGGMNVQGILSTTDFQVILVTYDEIYELENGTKTRFLNDKLVVNIPTDFTGKTIFAALKTKATNSIDGKEVNMPALVEAEYNMRPFWDDRTLTGGLMLNSSPLVIPNDVDLIHTMQVVA